MVDESVADATEEWRPVVGYEGWYLISALGRIRRVKKFGGAVVGRILRPHIGAGNPNSPSDSRYAVVGLFKDGVRKKWYVHHLVAYAFLGLRPEGMHINHKDGNKINNAAQNLEYVTPSENGLHCNRLGLNPQPQKLSDEEIRTIRASDGTCKALGVLYGVAAATICRIRTRKRWRKIV